MFIYLFIICLFNYLFISLSIYDPISLYRTSLLSPLRGVLCIYRSEVDAERDISSLGVRTGGWVEVDVSAAAVAVAAVVAAVVALGL